MLPALQAAANKAHVSLPKLIAWVGKQPEEMMKELPSLEALFDLYNFAYDVSFTDEHSLYYEFAEKNIMSKTWNDFVDKYNLPWKKYSVEYGQVHNETVIQIRAF